MTTLVATGLTVRIGDRVVLADAELMVPSGAVQGLVRPAGSGTSTLLAVLAGLRPPDAGRVSVGDVAADDAWIGYLEQQHDLPGGLTAAETVAVPLLARGRLSRRDWGAVDAALDAVRLPEASRHNLFEELSGGQQQRVAIARALIGDPVAIVLDDPLSELDEDTAAAMRVVIRRAADRGAAVVVGSSDGAIAAWCDAVLES